MKRQNKHFDVNTAFKGVLLQEKGILDMLIGYLEGLQQQAQREWEKAKDVEVDSPAPIKNEKDFDPQNNIGDQINAVVVALQLVGYGVESLIRSIGYSREGMERAMDWSNDTSPEGTQSFLEQASYTIGEINKGMAEMKAYLTKEDLEKTSPKIYKLGIKIQPEDVTSATMESVASQLEALASYDILKQAEKVFSQEGADAELDGPYSWAKEAREKYTPSVEKFGDAIASLEGYIEDIKKLEDLVEEKSKQPQAGGEPVDTEVF